MQKRHVRLILALCGACLLGARGGLRATSPSRVAAWLPTSWDGARARTSWHRHRQQIDELSPVWYQLDISGDGSINPLGGARDTDLVAEAHAEGVQVIPLINNYYDSFDYVPVSRIIHSPTLRAAHIATLVDEAVAYNYDGIDIDYESLNGMDDREAFSLFIEELAVALHAENKLLAIAIHPKTSEPGGWSGPQAQDWARIGAAADRFRMMTYGYSWSTSDPGPIAPLHWMEDVASFATSTVTPSKVYVGLHFYGLDWSTGPTRSWVWEDVQTLITTTGAVRQWQARDTYGRRVAEPFLTYVDTEGESHEVWYADGESIAARLGLVDRQGLGGVAIWRLGGEDQANWQAIAAKLQGEARAFLPTLLSERP